MIWLNNIFWNNLKKKYWYLHVKKILFLFQMEKNICLRE